MLKLANLAEFVAELKGDISEPGRTLIARRLANLVGTSLQGTPEYQVWLKEGCKTFFAYCELTCPERWVPDNLKISETQLAAFCNKWMSVSQFRLKDEEWRTITPELNGLRVTMIEELKSLAK
jgi:hypothetical protein